MVLAVITFLGKEFELVIRPRSSRPSLPPPTFITTAEPVEPATAPGVVKVRPALRVVREVA